MGINSVTRRNEQSTTLTQLPSGRGAHQGSKKMAGPSELLGKPSRVAQTQSSISKSTVAKVVLTQLLANTGVATARTLAAAAGPQFGPARPPLSTAAGPQMAPPPTAGGDTPQQENGKFPWWGGVAIGAGATVVGGGLVFWALPSLNRDLDRWAAERAARNNS
jgi:hypothetical protein